MAGTTVDRLREMVGLAIVTPGPDGKFGPSDIARVRIADSMDQAGIELDQVGSMIADGSYSTGWADILFPEPVPMSGQTLREAATELGLPVDLVHRTFTVGWQLPSPGVDEEIRDDDLEMLRLFALVYHSLGGDGEIAFSAVRYLGDNIRRLSESQMRFFRETIEEPMIRKDSRSGNGWIGSPTSAPVCCPSGSARSNCCIVATWKPMRSKTSSRTPRSRWSRQACTRGGDPIRPRSLSPT